MQYLSMSNSFLHFHGIPPKKKNKKTICLINSYKTSNRNNDVIIVGAGVAGSALAYALAKDGRNVYLIEKNLNEPKRFVGELLQPAGYLKLVELGLERCLKEIDAQIMVGYAIYIDGKSTRLPYPLEEFGTGSDVSGRTFHNGRFVQKLRNQAASLPNVKLEQGTATSLIEKRGIIKGVTYKNEGGQAITVHAPLTVVCDGGFSSLRKHLAKPKIYKPSNVVGVIAENCQVPYKNYGHAIMGDQSSIVFYPISSTEVRFCIDIPGPNLPSISNGQMALYLKNVVAPQVPPEMFKAFISSVEKGEISTMPVSCMAAAPLLIPGALLLGDALNMRHSISGGGMTVALQDVTLIRNLFNHLDLDDTNAVMKYTQHFYNFRKPMAFTINVMANSVHKLLCASPVESRKQIQQGYFNYLLLGHAVIRGQTELISGLSPHPWNLLLNLFATAIYIFGSMIFTNPSPKQVYVAARVAMDMAETVIPLILDEGLREVFTTKVPEQRNGKLKKLFNLDFFFANIGYNNRF